MSQLSIFRPSSAYDGPQILSFATFAARVKSNQLFDVATRAKLEYRNQCCPECRRATVEPIEMNDPILSRNGSVIPKSATLLGFCCNACGHRWARD